MRYCVEGGRCCQGHGGSVKHGKCAVHMRILFKTRWCVAQIDSLVAAIDTSQEDILMKYLYAYAARINHTSLPTPKKMRADLLGHALYFRLMERAEECAKILKWHERLVKQAGMVRAERTNLLWVLISAQLEAHCIGCAAAGVHRSGAH